MKEYTINVYNVNTLETIDTFVAEFENVTELCEFMDTELHNYNEKYTNLDYKVKGWYKMNNQNTPKHYQGTIQPIDLINAQNLNFNLGNVVKYVCRAGKKQGENILSDLEKAKNYINYEIERIKKWQVFIYWF